MSDCVYSDRVDAYHDGAMTEREAERMADHIRTCPSCAERLRLTRAIGLAVAEFSGERMPPAARVRLRQVVADAVDRGPARFAWELTGLAASVLVAATIWLATLPANAEAGSSSWENAAATGGQSIQSSAAQVQSADARFASWVVSDLADEQEEP